MPPAFLRRTKSSTLTPENTGEPLEGPSPATANNAVTSTDSATTQQLNDGPHSAADQQLSEVGVQPSGIHPMPLSPSKPDDVTTARAQSPPSGGMDPPAPPLPDVPQPQPLPQARPRPRPRPRPHYVPPVSKEPEEMPMPAPPPSPSQTLAPTRATDQAHDQRIADPVPAQQNRVDADLDPSLDLSDFPNHCCSEYAVIVEKVDWGTPWYECVRAAVDMQRSAGYPVRALFSLSLSARSLTTS